MSSSTLDTDFARASFPQMQDDSGLVFCCNAGGSYVAEPVLNLLDQYNRHMRVQPYNTFSPSREAGDAMDRARSGWSQSLNIADGELTIGPSTSINTYVMAQALGANWGPGDEIVLTQQDHEANHGVWRREAEGRGAIVREWPVDPDTGLLHPEQLYPLLNEHTRWVFFTQCSNLMGTTNPVAEIVAGIRQHSGARVAVDAVAYAPHHICDLKSLDVDLYYFSLYKVFGPHQGIMYVRDEVQEALAPQCHFFNQQDSRKRFNPAGPQHAQVAACTGVLDYLSALYRHHCGAGEDSPATQMAAVHELMAVHETSLAAPLVDYLHHSPRVRLLGKSDCRDGDRMATIAFQPLQQSCAQLVSALQAQGIGTESGHFYAPRALSALGINPDEGVVRLSLLHYNTATEVDRILRALDETVG